MKIKAIEKTVEKILMENERSRSDDFILTLLVFKEIGGDKVFWVPFHRIMEQHKELGLPSFASITRARRKIFEKHPELKPEPITKKREELEDEFREYAKG